MTKYTETLDLILSLLSSDPSLSGWQKTVQQVRDMGDVMTLDSRQEIKSWFGGMGSINDLYIMEYGQPSFEKNQQLSAALNALYDLVISEQS